MTQRLVLEAVRAGAAVWLVAARGKQARQVAGAVFAFLWLYPTLRRNCAWHGPLLRHLPNCPGVWLTIDDGPDPRCTPLYLDVLRAHEARASFFAIGARVRALPALARRIVEEGHSLENHTQTHPAGSWWLAGPWRTRREIARCTRSIHEVTSRLPRFFRAPVGMINPWVHACLGNLQAVGWSVTAADACEAPPSRVASTLLNGAQPGAILVIHAGRRERHRARALEMVLEGLRERGLRCALPPGP